MIHIIKRQIDLHDLKLWTLPVTDMRHVIKEITMYYNVHDELRKCQQQRKIWNTNNRQRRQAV